MSHISTNSVVVKDDAALERAAIRQGFTFHRGVTEFQAWRRKNPCAHVIRKPGERYEIGVVARPEGGFSLQADLDMGGLNEDDVASIAERYATEVTIGEIEGAYLADAKWTLAGETRLADGSIELEFTEA